MFINKIKFALIVVTLYKVAVFVFSLFDAANACGVFEFCGI